jgi:predicted nucleotidyltransferase component of viral defense system
MTDDLFDDFFLVGGTALTLQIGHRISIDLDLFSTKDFDESEKLTALENKYTFQLDFIARNTLKGRINGIKIDLISHKYPLVKPLLTDNGFRIASMNDISAMKLNAIVGNGTRLKDFVDIAYLSSFLSVSQMIDAYQIKYSARNPIMVMKSLAYHNDIDHNEPIALSGNNFEWKRIADRLNLIIKHPQQLFPAL